jgi:hypothetical protein
VDKFIKFFFLFPLNIYPTSENKLKPGEKSPPEKTNLHQTGGKIAYY